jgi:hypothetical protein
VKAYPPLVGDAPAPPPAPSAIRITRPYASEEDYLDRELETLTRASITLLGAQSRPQGVVLRFELALSSGVVLMRGEGRVVAFKANAFEGLGGLTLRFTRLDTRSKALVDRAAALREKRRPSTRPQMPDAGDLSPDRIPAPPEPSLATAPSISTPDIPAPAISRQPTPVPPPVGPSTLTGMPSSMPQAPSVAREALLGAPPERDSLLERLRARARNLDPGDVERMLTTRR